MNHPQIRRGDIFIYDFGPYDGSRQGGLRPAIVLQNDKQNMRSTTTIIAPLTSKSNKKAFMKAHVAVSPAAGLLYESQILLEQSVTVQAALLGTYIGHVSDEKTLQAIDFGLCELFGIQSFPVNTGSSKQEVNL